MLKVDGCNLTISQGDTLDLTFKVNGYQLQSGDIVTFSVKDCKRQIVLKKIITQFVGNSIHVVVSAEEMAKLSIGTKFYDLSCTSKDKIITFNFPASLTVREVMH